MAILWLVVAITLLVIVLYMILLGIRELFGNGEPAEIDGLDEFEWRRARKREHIAKERLAECVQKIYFENNGSIN